MENRKWVEQMINATVFPFTIYHLPFTTNKALSC